ncbi:RNA-binding protein Cwf29 [Schizosaccharomyces pombe]|uniref:Pre-mRNA-splicing factor cwf29 n=1 Tax=Schizosaccharomyces pombe (strain 972 / ATCC 24843) TaxID=284812 RepID=IST3_SCHPO|nr:RNA-binding protein Cwf29 [Schizosaccharomyces pombe]O94290.1 RecName: Full=U2 snRNP component ist3; AltName: Full=Complexed with cdc5 protein 29; AltName: Full=RNA-binding protein cwf29 [Schizosaccharomyces pombe 972h-]CAA21890.1 RNA-binding protein Cwf29 [Schizosaccharomyces pombe]|eukprot:NP_596479.1 RNA-binding protein Cwf29 [Schizosaccharomyces pombe]
MNSIRQIERLNEQELDKPFSSSWHQDYSDSAYIYIGNLDFDLNEDDILCVFSEFGEPVDINLVRDKETGKSKGFAFLKYEDQRSTVLAVDNMTNVKLLDRLVRVDHVASYKVPQKEKEPANLVPLGESGSSLSVSTINTSNLPDHDYKTIIQNEVEQTLSPKDEKDLLDPMRDYIHREKRRKLKHESSDRSDKSDSNRHSRHHRRHSRSRRHRDLDG